MCRPPYPAHSVCRWLADGTRSVPDTEDLSMSYGKTKTAATVHVVPMGVLAAVFAALLLLTGLTVAVAGVDLAT